MAARPNFGRALAGWGRILLGGHNDTNGILVDTIFDDVGIGKDLAECR